MYPEPRVQEHTPKSYSLKIVSRCHYVLMPGSYFSNMLVWPGGCPDHLWAPNSPSNACACSFAPAAVSFCGGEGWGWGLKNLRRPQLTEAAPPTTASSEPTAPVNASWSFKWMICGASPNITYSCSSRLKGRLWCRFKCFPQAQCRRRLVIIMNFYVRWLLRRSLSEFTRPGQCCVLVHCTYAWKTKFRWHGLCRHIMAGWKHSWMSELRGLLLSQNATKSTLAYLNWSVRIRKFRPTARPLMSCRHVSLYSNRGNPPVNAKYHFSNMDAMFQGWNLQSF